MYLKHYVFNNYYKTGFIFSYDRGKSIRIHISKYHFQKLKTLCHTLNIYFLNKSNNLGFIDKLQTSRSK